jgi:hypothetical protein
MFLLASVLVMCALLATFAPRIRPVVVSAILALCAVAIFAVRFRHEGPYPFPGGLDLATALASLVLALLVVLLGWNSARRGSPLFRAALALVPIVLLSGLAAVLHEVEEVVVLRTFDDRGGVLETRLWVVDYHGAAWLITGADARHTHRLEARPQVELVRHGTARCQTAVPFRDRATIQEVLRRRGEKYVVQRIGLAIGFDRLFRSRELPIESYAVAIRLDPCPAEPVHGNLGQGPARSG